MPRLTPVLALPMILLMLAGCQKPLAGGSDPESVVGTWVAVGSTFPEQDDVFSAKLILDEDGYAMGQATEKDSEEVNGKKIAVPGESFTIEGTWEKRTSRRVEVTFTLDDDDETLEFTCICWLTGPDTMTATFIVEEGESFEISLRRGGVPGAER